MLIIERIRGGCNPLTGRGEVDCAQLSAVVRASLEAHFSGGKQSVAHGNEPVYRLSRASKARIESIELPEHLMPPGLIASVKDQLP